MESRSETDSSLHHLAKTANTHDTFETMYMQVSVIEESSEIDARLLVINDDVIQERGEISRSN